MISNPYAFQSGQSAARGLAGFFGVFFGVYYVIVIGFGIATYILESLGTYTIAKRRGIHHSWLAWVPVGSAWLLGSISDQYQYIAKGTVHNRRKVLLGLNLALVCVPVLAYALFIGLTYAGNGDAALYGAAAALVLLACLAVIVLSVITAVFRFMALYDLYASCVPNSAVLYLIFSILFGVTVPFFVFTSRKSDAGMPPRRPAPENDSPAPEEEEAPAPETESSAPEVEEPPASKEEETSAM